jgi:hypothetical protein
LIALWAMALLVILVRIRPIMDAVTGGNRDSWKETALGLVVTAVLIGCGLLGTVAH